MLTDTHILVIELLELDVNDHVAWERAWRALGELDGAVHAMATAGPRNPVDRHPA